MKLENITKTLAIGALALSMYACTPRYEPTIEVYRGDYKNRIKIELQDGTVVKEVSREYIKLDISDSIRYEIDGHKKVLPRYINEKRERKQVPEPQSNNLLPLIMMTNM